MKEKLQVKCPRCDGDGLVTLAQGLLQVLKLASETRGITAVGIHKKLDPGATMHPTAFNNRLEDLFRSGLLRREKNGRSWIYYKTPTRYR